MHKFFHLFTKWTQLKPAWDSKLLPISLKNKISIFDGEAQISLECGVTRGRMWCYQVWNLGIKLNFPFASLSWCKAVGGGEGVGLGGQSIWMYPGCGRSRFTIVSMQTTGFILVLLLIHYCIIFHTNNCKPTWATPSIFRSVLHLDRSSFSRSQTSWKWDFRRT